MSRPEIARYNANMKQIFEETPQNLANLVFLPKIRLECIDLERHHYKFYEIETEPVLLFPKITRRWGRIGCKRPRAMCMNFTYYNEMKQEVDRIVKTRYNHGYKLNEEIPL